MPDPRLILDKAALQDRIQRIADSIRQRCQGPDLALVGIYKRGVPLAERIYELLKPHYQTLLLGRVDITLYRDDINRLQLAPKLVGTDIPFDLDDQHIILFDEVMQSGRTVRAALDELLDYGRPARVELAVLIDRRGREMPITPDYIGDIVQVLPSERVKVRFTEVDTEDAVYVQE